MLRRLATYAIEPNMNKPSIIIKPFNPEDEMRKLYLPSSKAGAYFSLTEHAYNAKLWAPVANAGHVWEELLVKEFFPGQKNNNTYYYNPLGICATPDVITHDGDYVEIKTVQKKTPEALAKKFQEFFWPDNQMNLCKILEDPKKTNILGHLTQCLFALYVLNEAHEEAKDYYYLIYCVCLTNETFCYRLQINNTKKFRGWIKILCGLYDSTEGQAPYKKKTIPLEITQKVKEFLTVDYVEDFLQDCKKKIKK